MREVNLKSWEVNRNQRCGRGSTKILKPLTSEIHSRYEFYQKLRATFSLNSIDSSRIWNMLHVSSYGVPWI